MLVTGATGFIGRQSLPLLTKRGYEVHGTYLQREPEHQRGISFHRVDLLDPAQTTALLKEIRPSHLLHFAWYAIPGLYWTSNENLRWLEASQHLIQEFRSRGGKRLVSAGTCAQYDWSLGNELFIERITPSSPATPYGQSKQSIESIITLANKESSMTSAVGRIFMLYGPYEHPDRLVSGVIRGLLQHEPVPCSLGNQARDVLYVKDVASAFVALMESQVSGCINIASGQSLCIKDLIQQIATTLGGESLIEWGKRPMPTREPVTLVADVRRLREEVGWTPAYSLTKGLNETIAWWSRQLAAISDP